MTLLESLQYMTLTSTIDNGDRQAFVFKNEEAAKSFYMYVRSLAVPAKQENENGKFIVIHDLKPGLS